MRLALVIHRFGASLGGGAEQLAYGFATTAARLGHHVEIWTTCAQNHYTWDNELPAGYAQTDNLHIYRFPITSWQPDQRALYEHRIDVSGALSLPDQDAWLEAGPQSPTLYAHVAQHAPSMDAVIILPYLVSLNYYAAWAAGDKAYLWPCLHDEAYAYLQRFHLLLESVAGVFFNAPEEADLAINTLRLNLNRHAVIGVGVLDEDAIPPLPTPTPPTTPYLFYLGRLETGKNLPLLYDYVSRYQTDHPHQLQLHLAGRGPCLPPDDSAFHYHGFVSEAEKTTLCANALAICQPSLNESFSIVIMEGWLAGRPALTHRDSAVTTGHVQRSKGGLFFRTYPEFVGTINWLRQHPSETTRMGLNGRNYVLQNYTWETIIDRFTSTLNHWSQEPTP
ncbi:MAG TPA: glycosyltransferase family 4 protein [Anaerolineae bacterium]|nr:glycosyltransferase family 4 protein [Anaerolineae bacterium]